MPAFERIAALEGFGMENDIDIVLAVDVKVSK